MEERFDFDKIKKRMPYELPPDTFREIDSKVWAAVKADKRYVGKTPRRLWRGIAGLSVAACVALLLSVRPEISTSSETWLERVDLAYAGLSDADREAILELYSEDIFINQE